MQVYSRGWHAYINIFFPKICVASIYLFAQSNDDHMNKSCAEVTASLPSVSRGEHCGFIRGDVGEKETCSNVFSVDSRPVGSGSKCILTPAVRPVSVCAPLGRGHGPTGEGLAAAPCLHSSARKQIDLLILLNLYY